MPLSPTRATSTDLPSNLEDLKSLTVTEDLVLIQDDIVPGIGSIYYFNDGQSFPDIILMND